MKLNVNVLQVHKWGSHHITSIIMMTL